MNKVIASLTMLWAGLGACASSEGTAPHDMSAAEHDEMAAAEEVLANEHAAKYDPNAVRERPICSGVLARKSGYSSDVCWGSVTNATETHQVAADERRRLAAEHRAASQALRDAEARACAGLGEEERDTSPFEHVEDIASVGALRFPNNGKVDRSRLRPPSGGAVVSFVAVPGMTAEWLQRVVDCHLARNAALGHVDPTMPDCPLVLKGVTATVKSTGNGFAVAMRSQDPAVASEILRRARLLIQTPGPQGNGH